MRDQHEAILRSNQVIAVTGLCLIGGAGMAAIVAGACFVLAGATGNTSVEMAGMHIASSNVGAACVAAGLVSVVAVIYRTHKLYERVTVALTRDPSLGNLSRKKN